jgi:hypothetical protein
MRILRFLLLLALIVWLGGIIFFGMVMAPTLFHVLPTPLAGLVVSKSLVLLHWIGMGCAVVMAVAMVALRMRSKRPLNARLVMLAGMLILTAVSRFAVTPRMEAIRSSAGGDLQSLATSDPRRQQFDRLHHWSTGLEMGVLLLGLYLVAEIARE